MPTEECEKVIQKIKEYLTDDSFPSAKFKMLVEHIQTCESCQTNMSFLLRSLGADIDDPLTCSECEERLVAYAWAGELDTPEWQAVRQHLSLCPACSADLAALKELAALDEREDEDPIPYPEHKGRIEGTPWGLDKFGRLLLQFSESLLRKLQLATALRPAFVKKESARTIYEWTLPKTADGTLVTLLAQAKRTDATRCQLHVTVEIAGLSWPSLAKTMVRIEQDGTELDTLLTDSHGTAVFSNIPVAALAHLAFIIQPRPQP